MAKRKEPKGTTIIEFNHSGIPDDELKPEAFNDYQLAVLKALPPRWQTCRDNQASSESSRPILYPLR